MEPWEVEEDSLAVVPLVVRGEEIVPNNSLFLAVNYGKLHVEEDGDHNSIVGAEDSFTLTGSIDRLNYALKHVWYTPPANWNSLEQRGFETITASLDEHDEPDGGITSNGSEMALMIRVAAVNDGPSLQTPEQVMALEGQAVTIKGIKVEDLDVDEARGVVEVTVSLGMEGSHIELGTLMGLYMKQSSAERVTFQGSLERVNNAFTGLTYRGAPEFSGKDELLITVDDLGNTGEGGSLTSSSKVPIQISSVNSPPGVKRNDREPITGVEDEPIPLTGIMLEDPDAGDADIKLVIEARYGTVRLVREHAGINAQERDQQLASRLELRGSLEVRRIVTNTLPLASIPSSPHKNFLYFLFVYQLSPSIAPQRNRTLI